MISFRAWPVALSLLLPFQVFAIDGEELAARQCRSVHLFYDAPPSDWATIDVVVERSAPGTYFCALAFDGGYFGMQELADGKKVILFSAWDKADPDNQTDRPQDTRLENRVGVIQVGEGVREQRFGGEGTGSQSFFDYEWTIGEPVRFAVQAETEAGFTTYTGQFYDAHRKSWQLMASFRTHNDAPLKSLYSFIEDFRRNYESARIVRRARFLQGWVRDLAGDWQPMTRARFTADNTPSENIDAGPVPDGFFLQTGGDTRNEQGRLRETLTRPTPERTQAPDSPKEAPRDAPPPPIGLPAASR